VRVNERELFARIRIWAGVAAIALAGAWLMVSGSTP
jgi:hypothetical protein